MNETCHECQAHLSAKDVANHLNLSYSYLNKLRMNQTGPAYMKIGRRVTYLLSDVNEWADLHKRNQTKH